MAETQDLLVEIGTEEMPPRSLRLLSRAFGEGVAHGLDAAGIGRGAFTTYATPRRLATVIEAVEEGQAERAIERRGPAITDAFDDAGNATKAALGFARSCGVEVAHLERAENEQGAWLLFRTTEVGQATASLLPEIVRGALAKLPIARRMRWGELEEEFVRPVHWVVMLHGDSVVEGRILGIASGRQTRGHRFHSPNPLPVESPAGYAMLLYGNAHVIADLDTRAETIREQVTACAAELGAKAVIHDDLLEEVTALVEWPVAVAGSFDESFLELPDGVLIAVMRGHQRCFPVVSDSGALMPHFIAVSNIESRSPEKVRTGNERVIRPRLADAKFFYDADLRTPLEDQLAGLKEVVFQEKLGTLHDKAERVSKLAGHVAISLGENPDRVKLARRAGLLCKCDLRTELVGEFPELQGTVGRDLALRGGEPEEVAVALEEAYMPRFAGDGLPASSVGRVLAIADRLDTLIGIFAIGQAPTGDRDPFGLRRAALGALRIIIEGQLVLDLPKLLQAARDQYGKGLPSEGPEADVAERVHEFILDRLRAYFVDQGVPADVFSAVSARPVRHPYDFALRVRAVHEFRQLPAAASLAAANKRIQNILKQADVDLSPEVRDELFSEDAEWNLAAKMVGIGPRVRDLLKAGDYSTALKSLAGLRDTVDAFFDTVKVMDDNPEVRRNRLAMLNNIGDLFLETADVSQLQIEEPAAAE